MNHFSTWPYFWFGCWSEFGEQYLKCPSIHEYTDSSWNYESIKQLLAYINTAPIIATTSRLSIPWAIGNGDNRSSISYRSDDTWVWLDDIDYYVIQHNLRLPDNFIFHIEKNNYISPKEINKDIQELPWPPVG